MRTAMLMLVPGLLVLACQRGPEMPPGAPADVVQQLHAAVAAGDCQTALAQLAAAYRGELETVGCEHFLEKMRELPLERIVETKVDGRDPGARLVRIRVHQRTSDIIVRVEVEGGQWKITAM